MDIVPCRLPCNSNPFFPENPYIIETPAFKPAKEHQMSSEFDSLLPRTGFSRREFVVTALGAGFALATHPVMADSAISTPADGLLAGEVKIPAAGGEMPAYRAAPAEKPKDGTLPPLILVVQEVFGVHEYIKDICRRLARLGYFAVAPELYARHGDPRLYPNIQDLLEKLVSKVPDAEVLSDLDAAFAWAGSNGADAKRSGITGFCWGGRIVWLYCARNPQIRAGVAWYGRISGASTELTPQHPLDIAAALKAPVQGLYAGEDQGIPASDVGAMRVALEQAAKAGNTAAGQSRIHLYPGVPHAFHADYRPSYRKPEAEDGWRRMMEWFDRHGLPSTPL